ncbi:hypothetical protein ET33_12315 [Paenibacillus tyrfis]|uniref:Uncharacterized protein n=3 Tax=Paenibacillus tyrfis TaxID=1501230 RepID=A0A081NZE2_9BACL|nr:hypothetical protein ET33_12315 [Paenibacillus tyrfis]
MVLIKDSAKREEIQALHTELWNELQHYDEAFAENFMTNCLKNLKERQVQRNTLKNFVTTRGFWISVLVGSLLGPSIVVLFIWVSLWIE